MQLKKETGVKREKTHSLEHEHILSGILRCPVCHGAMYSNVNRKKKPDGTYYKDFFYYACKHRLKVDGHNCSYHHQWGQDKVNAAVEEVIYKLVNNPKFQDALKNKVGAKTDTEELEKERDICRTKLRQAIGAKNKLADQMDALDVSDRFYDRKYDDMQERMNKLYEEIGAIEDEIDTISMRIENINKKQLSKDSIYRILKSFDKIYSEFTDAEKKRFINSFVESVEIFEEDQEDGRFLKSIKFRFPVYYNGAETQEVNLSDSSWDYQKSLETVVLLSKGVVDSEKVKVDFSLEDMDLSEFKGKATYEQIKAYVLEKTGLKVSSLYIAQIKKKCGLDVGENFNPAKSENARQPQCTPEKEDAIMQAFSHFGII